METHTLIVIWANKMLAAAAQLHALVSLHSDKSAIQIILFLSRLDADW